MQAGRQGRMYGTRQELGNNNNKNGCAARVHHVLAPAIERQAQWQCRSWLQDVHGLTDFHGQIK